MNLNIDLTEIDEATSGHKALELVKEEAKKAVDGELSYCIIFMDCNMPHMDGYQCTSKIRNYLYSKKIKQPLITAVTGHQEQVYVDRSIVSGMN